MFDQFGCLRGEVDADPLAAQFLGGDAGSGAPAERIQHHITGVGGRGDDPAEQGERLLSWIPDLLFGVGFELADVREDVLDRPPVGGRQIPLQRRHRPPLRPVDEAVVIQRVQAVMNGRVSVRPAGNVILQELRHTALDRSVPVPPVVGGVNSPPGLP